MITLVLDILDFIGKIDDQKYLDLCKKNPESSEAAKEKLSLWHQPAEKLVEEISN